MKNSNYTFEILVNNKSLKEYEHKKKTYVEGRKGSEYTLYFRNNTYNSVKVCFSVDGLSVMDGKTASDKSQGYIVSGHDTLKIPGWRIDNSKTAAFQFRPQGEKEDKTYTEELKDAGFSVDLGNQGVIGCMVFKKKIPVTIYRNVHHYHHDDYHYPYYPVKKYLAQPYEMNGWSCSNLSDASGLVPMQMMNMNMLSQNNSGEAIPQSYGTLTASGASSASYNGATRSVFNMEEKSLGTAFGDDKEFKTHDVSFDSEDSPDWVASIFYDTILQLKKKGVIVEEDEPNPFPGYNQNGCYIPKRNR